MNEGWRMTKLGEICKISTGNANTEDAIENGPYAFFDRSKIIKKSSSYIFDCDAIIIPGEGQTFMPKLFSGKFNLHQRAYAIFNFEECVSIEYVYKYLIYFHKYFEEVAVGATVKSLRLRHFQELPIPIPPLPEQQRIVAILDEAFAAIDKATANAEKNLKNAKELFESYLQGVFENEEWTVKYLNEISENYDSKRIPITKNLRKEGSIPYYGASGVVDFVIDYIFDEDLLCVSEDGANLLARTYPIAFSISGKTWVNNHAHVLKFNDLSSQHFVGFYLNAIKLDDYISGMAQPKLNQAKLNTIPIPYPSLEVRTIVVDKLTSLAAETKRLESIYQHKLTDLEELKKSILQKAFNGELNTVDICV